MPKKKSLWSSKTGIIASIFLLVGLIGAVFEFISHYLSQFEVAFQLNESISMVGALLNVAVMLYVIIIIIYSIVGIPKSLWIVLTFQCLLFVRELLST